MKIIIAFGILGWLLITLLMVLSIVGLIFLIPFYEEWYDVFKTLTDILKEK